MKPEPVLSPSRPEDQCLPRLRLAWETEVAVVPFDEIIPRILDGTYLSGLIIHEGQLTYVDHDLNVLIDLGKWWNANKQLAHATRG